MRISALAASAAMSAVFAAAPALAGDAADRTLLGFSDDGTVFAFGESGVQDGSGFPYANVYLVDVIKDEWAAPPVQIMLREPESGDTVGDAVEAAMGQAWPHLRDHHVNTPGRLLWSHPTTEAPTGDPEAHGDYPGAIKAEFTNGWDGTFTLQLDTLDAPDGDCAQYDADIEGFALTLGTIGAEMEIYRDDEIPESRGCPLGYSISDVIEGPYTEDGDRPLVILVNVFKKGFEGPDRRFIAIPVMPPQTDAPPRPAVPDLANPPG